MFTPGRATNVAVSLSEYTVIPTPSSAFAGTISFDVTNYGTVEHEFLVVRTDLAPGSLPTNADLSYEEDGPGTTLVDEIPGIPVGQSASLVLDLPAGHYVLLCNEVVGGMSHYHMGMHAAFTLL